MFYRTESGVWRATLLDAFEWLEHGFGTRLAGPDPGNVVTLRQVHSAVVVHADGARDEALAGDALVTSRAGLRLGVRTADCLPILLADPERRAVAAVHAGWRGTLLGVAARAVESMSRLFGSRPDTLYAAMGPGIRGCCYEVGPEVAVQFRGLLPELNDCGGPARLDLEEANRRLLLRAGLTPGRIDCQAPCTFCGGPEFHSWRRDRESAGRMLSVAGIRA